MTDDYKKTATYLAMMTAMMAGDGVPSIESYLPEKYHIKYICKYSKCGKEFHAESLNKTTCCCKEHFFLYLEEKRNKNKENKE